MYFKNLLPLFALVLLAGTSCQKKMDIEKEKEAIQAVFEAEKAAYFKQDDKAMGEFWIKLPSSVKIAMSANGQKRYDGWDNINAAYQEEIQDTSWNRELVRATFTNYQINVRNTAAWVLCEANWEGIFMGDTISVTQTRINVLEKDDGKWKFSLMAYYTIPPVPESK